MRNSIMDCDSAQIGITEHQLAEGRLEVVMINYTPEAITPPLTLALGWKIQDYWYGKLPTIPGNDAVAFTLEKK